MGSVIHFVSGQTGKSIISECQQVLGYHIAWVKKVMSSFAASYPSNREAMADNDSW
jgi:hypothetical protein